MTEPVSAPPSPVSASTSRAALFTFCPGGPVCEGLCVGPVALAPGCPRAKYSPTTVQAPLPPDKKVPAMTANPDAESTAPPRSTAP